MLQGSMENARFLPPGQTLNLWLALETPESHGTSNRDVFQVAAELVATDGRVAATASRPCLVKYRSPLVSYIRSAICCLGFLAVQDMNAVHLCLHKIMWEHDSDGHASSG